MITLLHDVSAATCCACSVSMVWNRMVWTMYVARWSSRVAYKTLPESKWPLAAFKFTLILSLKKYRGHELTLGGLTSPLVAAPLTPVSAPRAHLSETGVVGEGGAG